MIVTFIGHGNLFITEELRNRIEKAIMDSIKKGANIFYCGGYGAFDNASAEIIRKLKVKHPYIRLFFITPYITESYQKRLKYINEMKFYDDIIYPDLEEAPYKFAILKRNQWMIDQADIMVVFVNHCYGGAYTTLQYAKRKKKTIINLAE